MFVYLLGGLFKWWKVDTLAYTYVKRNTNGWKLKTAEMKYLIIIQFGTIFHLSWIFFELLKDSVKWNSLWEISIGLDNHIYIIW